MFLFFVLFVFRFVFRFVFCFVCVYFFNIKMFYSTSRPRSISISGIVICFHKRCDEDGISLIVKYFFAAFLSLLTDYKHILTLYLNNVLFFMFSF